MILGSMIVVLAVAVAACTNEKPEERHAGVTTADYFLLRSGEALDEGDPAQALRFARQAYAADSTSARAAFVVGEALERLGRRREAAVAFRNVTRHDPSFPDAWLKLGNLAYAEKDYQSARTYYLKELSHRESPITWHNAGTAYLVLGNVDSAAAAFENALRLDPRHAPSLLSLSDVSDLNGDGARALAHAERALALQPADPAARRRVAMLYVRDDRTADALPLLEASASADPLDAEALYMLGQAYRRLGRTAESERTLARHAAASGVLDQVAQLEDRIDANPADEAARVRLATLLGAHKRYEDAVVHFRSILNRNPDHIDARVQLATIRAAQGAFEEAEALYRGALERDSSRARVWLYLGTMLTRIGRTEEGREALDRAKTLDPRLSGRVDSTRHGA